MMRRIRTIDKKKENRKRLMGKEKEKVKEKREKEREKKKKGMTGTMQKFTAGPIRGRVL